jgi:hypothetical protein
VKRLSLLVIIAACVVSLSVPGMSADFMIGGKKMVKNGSGVRTKSIFGTLYYLTLYVPENLKGKDGKMIIEANEPMSMVLVLDSSLVTRERFVETTTEGFAKSAAAGYSSPKKQAFLDQYKKIKFTKGDVISMTYTPAGLTTQIKYKESGKLETLGSIAGLDLKKALFAIWLGAKPVQDSLKASLLSGK